MGLYGGVSGKNQHYLGNTMVIAKDTKKTIDMSIVDVNKFSFVRYYDQVLINGEDSQGQRFELILGNDAASIIRQASSNLIIAKAATGV